MEVIGLSCCEPWTMIVVRRRCKACRPLRVTHLRQRLDMVPIVALASVDPDLIRVQAYSDLCEGENENSSQWRLGRVDVRERSALKAWQVIGLC